MSELTLQQRCNVATECLPDAPYRTMLAALHGEMNDHITELEAQLVAVQKDAELGACFISTRRAYF